VAIDEDENLRFDLSWYVTKLIGCNKDRRGEGAREQHFLRSEESSVFPGRRENPILSSFIVPRFNDSINYKRWDPHGFKKRSLRM